MEQLLEIIYQRSKSGDLKAGEDSTICAGKL